MPVSRRRRTRLVVALLAAVMLMPLAEAPVNAQDDVGDLRDQREENRRDAAEIAAQLDALSAEDQELIIALEALDAHILLQEARIAAAQDSIAAAEAQALAAEDEAAQLVGEMGEIRDRLRERAIAAFVAPRLDAVEQLNTDDLLIGVLRRSFLDEVVGDEYDLIDELRTAEADQESAQRTAVAAVAVAEAERAALEGRLDELDEARREAEDLRAEVEVRVGEWRAEGQEIDDADAAIAAEIRRLEEELARRAAEEAAAARAAAEAAENAANNPSGESDAEPVAPGSFEVSHRPVSGVITSDFGERVHPIFGTIRNHFGIDLDGDRGDPIVAAASGTVLTAGWLNGYGNTVVISHGDGFTTLYAHQDSLSVESGQTVDGGDQVGRVGSTGWSTGSHLHFEIRVEGIAVDPALYL